MQSSKTKQKKNEIKIILKKIKKIKDIRHMEDEKRGGCGVDYRIFGEMKTGMFDD